MAKRRITQTTPHDNPGTLVFGRQKSGQNANGVTLNTVAKYRWGRLNAGAIAVQSWQLSTCSVVNLARSQVYHTERPSYVFAANPCYTQAYLQLGIKRRALLQLLAAVRPVIAVVMMS